MVVQNSVANFEDAGLALVRHTISIDDPIQLTISNRPSSSAVRCSIRLSSTSRVLLPKSRHVVEASLSLSRFMWLLTRW